MYSTMYLCRHKLSSDSTNKVQQSRHKHCPTALLLACIPNIPRYLFVFYACNFGKILSVVFTHMYYIMAAWPIDPRQVSLQSMACLATSLLKRGGTTHFSPSLLPGTCGTRLLLHPLSPAPPQWAAHPPSPHHCSRLHHQR